MNAARSNRVPRRRAESPGDHLRAAGGLLVLAFFVGAALWAVSMWIGDPATTRGFGKAAVAFVVAGVLILFHLVAAVVKSIRGHRRR